MAKGWQRVLAGYPWFEGEGAYPIPAYSEFMPPPRLGQKAYGAVDEGLFADDDPFGWHITEYEEALEIAPGLSAVGEELLRVLRRLGRQEPAHGIAQKKLAGNPYWPTELHAAGAPPQERFVLLLPLALSRTQDDKGRLRWTIFGGSERGPDQAFWRGFYTAPDREAPIEGSLGFMRRLLAAAYGESSETLTDLRRAGFRVFETPQDALPSCYAREPLPSWAAPFRWEAKTPLTGVRYLLTFCPFQHLPSPVRRAYLAGRLHLIPFPGSLVHFGAPPYVQLQSQLPMAMQIPLLQSLLRHEAPHGLRIPQSGWLHERQENEAVSYESFGPVRSTFRRTHRWQRVLKQDDHLEVQASEDKLAHVLLSTDPDDVGLYGKPMARNCQIWTPDFHLLLDGPRAGTPELAHAAEALRQGGMFGYRMLYPAMRVGRHEVYWHRPLVAYFDRKNGEPVVLPDGPRGYLTAYPYDKLKLDAPVELWPRLEARPLHETALRIFTVNHEHHYRQTMLNVRKLLDAYEMLGSKPLEESFARQLLTLAKHETLDDWLKSLPDHASDRAAAEAIADSLRERIVEQVSNLPLSRQVKNMPHAKAPQSLTFDRTARRAFEKKYWQTIAGLATGQFINKDNADCVLDPATRSKLAHHHRDLEALGDHLLKYYDQTVEAAGMTGKAIVGELPFQWRTDFQFSWSGGWQLNQEQATYERDLVLVIPGRDRRRAVIMADHYDTAYMEDMYGYPDSKGGPRLAAAGADDNHSATAALMLAAPIYLDLAREGKLECDIWLVHLTGEEFPADCMGARHLCQQLVEGGLRIRATNGRWRSLAKARAAGVFVLDMVAHNNDHDRDVFQICPGDGRQSMWLAQHAHAANETWNRSTGAWNRRADRRGCGRGKRSADGRTMPDTALHPALSGEIRPAHHPRSALYNTDGQIFSDAGVPVVLFMENYDINRKGYHDTHDTLENIDLDYGSAVAAIAIETVARVASTMAPAS